MEPATLIVGGESELRYLEPILAQVHPWADLRRLGVTIERADGDSKIPALVEKSCRAGRRVLVLFDRDALARAHEQAEVINRPDVEPYELRSDFEAAFDPVIVSAALVRLGYAADTYRLQQARLAERPFDAIEECATPGPDPRHLTKTSLATTLSAISAETWYVPEEIYRAVIRLGEVSGAPPMTHAEEWLGTPDVPAIGRLYLCNHVSNDAVRYFDFDRRELREIGLPGTFDGMVSPCRQGARFVVRKFERRGATLPAETWIHVLDWNGEALISADAPFRIRGSVYGLRADEDGNHLILSIQEEDGRRLGVRCLSNGTQRDAVSPDADDGLDGARISPGRRCMASGPQPLIVRARVLSDSGEAHTRIEIELPHFHAHSFTWSPCSRFLAFYGRRWGKTVKSQDCLWVLDAENQRVSRLAIGARFMPAYWARSSPL
jgi:hypothetical protein